MAIVIFIIITFFVASVGYDLNQKRYVEMAKNNINRYLNIVTFMVDPKHIQHIRFHENVIEIMYQDRNIPNLKTQYYYKAHEFNIVIHSPKEAYLTEKDLRKMKIKMLKDISVVNLINNSVEIVYISEESIDQLVI